GDGGAEPWGLGVGGRRAGGDHADRRLRAAVAGGGRPGRDPGRGKLSDGAARISAIYAAAAVAGAGGAGAAAVRRSCADPRLAPGRRGGADPAAPAPSLGNPPRAGATVDP